MNIKYLGQIIFRGKGKYSNDVGFTFGNLRKTCYAGEGLTEEKYYISNDGTGEYYSCKEVVPETIGRFIGINDKNGKHIFEDDIVKFKMDNALNYTTERVGVVAYGPFICSTIPAFRIDTVTGDSRSFYDVKDVEVIGNIHDNYDLLEKSKMREI